MRIVQSFDLFSFPLPPGPILNYNLPAQDDRGDGQQVIASHHGSALAQIGLRAVDVRYALSSLDDFEHSLCGEGKVDG